MKTKIEIITNDCIVFENGCKLSSYHPSDCCEHHYLDFSGLDLLECEDMEFDLDDENFFTRIDGYGIALNSTNNFPLRIPGYGSNNGYYSSELNLVLTDSNGVDKYFDITYCQEISD